jgi:hypothetical protein
MDDQSRRDEHLSGNGRHAASETNDAVQRDERAELPQRRDRTARSPLTQREREERWPIG